MWLLWLALVVDAEGRVTTADIRAAVQPVLNQMAQAWNMSFSFGFTHADGSVALAAGKDDVWQPHSLANRLQPHSLVPLGSVTKPWTALRIMQHVEAGDIELDDLVYLYVDSVLNRLYGADLASLWGADARNVTVGDCLGMTSGFPDYTDKALEKLTLSNAGDDIDPFMYLRNAAHQGWVCKPGACASYSGVNFVILGFVLVSLDGTWSWQDFDQRTVIPRSLWRAGRYQYTSFPKLGRCAQYPGLAHQWAMELRRPDSAPLFMDLELASCLNGWTMGNIATTGEDLSRFFYDIFNQTAFVNATTLARMQQWHRLRDTWCFGPGGKGTCQYGLGLLIDQVGQDIWPLLNETAEARDAARVVGHPGEDWGSGCSPCGYNALFGFGVCVAYTALSGMNCSRSMSANEYAVFEASCLAYDAVLARYNGPRLNCTIPVHPPLPPNATDACLWEHINPGNHSPIPIAERAASQQGHSAHVGALPYESLGLERVLVQLERS